MGVQDQNQGGDVHELRERIVDEWDKLDQCIIDKAVGGWQEISSLCGLDAGGQIEHEM